MKVRPEKPSANDWPQASGEMAQRIRTYDWVSTPLGSLANWSPFLKGSIQLMLDSRVPMMMALGRDYVLIYNDALIALAGARHPEMLGAPFRKGWQAFWSAERVLLEDAMAGQGGVAEHVRIPLTSEDSGEVALLRADFVPWHAENGFVEGVVVTFFDTTERIGGAQKLSGEPSGVNEQTERQAFMLKLTDALRPVDDPGNVIHEACRLLAEELDVDRAYYIEVDEEAGIARVERDFVRGGAPSLAGEHRIEDFGWSVEILRRGECHVVDDTQTSRIVSEADRAASAALQIISCMGAPLIKQGALVGGLCVTGARRRNWKESEATLLQEVSERIWAAVEQLHAESPHRESESRLRALVQASSDVVYRMSPNWTEMRQLLGRDFIADTHETSESWLEQYIAEPDRSVVLAAINEAIRSKSTFELEHRVVRVDGSLGWTFSRAVPLLDENGTITEWVGMASDVTKEKEQAIQLRESEELQRFLLEFSDALRAQTDATGIAELAAKQLADRFEADRCDLVEVNATEDRAKIVFSFARPDMVPLPVQAQPFEYVSEFRKLLARTVAVESVLNAPDLTEAERQGLSRIGVEAFIAAPVPRGNRHPIWLTTIVSRRPRKWTDTEIRIMEAASERILIAMEFAHAEALLSEHRRMEALSQLTGGIAHDMNNMLTVISGNLEMIQDAITDGDTKRRLISVLKTVELGAAFNRRLLAFSGRASRSPQTLFLNERVEAMAELLKHTLGEEIRIDTDLDPTLWHVSVDPGEIDSAIVNLAANARDSMPDGGRITISTRNRPGLRPPSIKADASVEDYVCLTVMDQGHGMTADEVARSVEPFYTTKDRGKGTGLGLSSVYGFVRQSSGFVDIASKPGLGTTVSLCLPKAAAWPSKPDIGDQEEAPRGNAEVILVVEDDDDVRDVTLGRLEILGYVVLEARDGPEAITILKNEPDIHLVLCDIVLPGAMSGYDIGVWLEQNRPETKVHLMSGYDDEIANRPDAPILPCLAKPHTKAQLARAVRTCLDS